VRWRAAVVARKMGGTPPPRVVRTLKREGAAFRAGPTGEVGTVLRTSGFEVVWVRKEHEVIDSKWFESSRIDVLVVVQGQLRVEFPLGVHATRTLRVGDVLVLPARTKCRGYRWPRTSRRATVFLAIYPIGRDRSRFGRHAATRS
jgi:uncharacterized protein YjlB